MELYDLRRDRRERDNIAERRKDLVESFTAQLLAWKQRERREGGAPEQTIDEETREELKALGYVVN